MTFKAPLATKTDKTISTSVVDVNEHDLMPGDVTIAVDYSTVNYPPVAIHPEKQS